MLCVECGANLHGKPKINVEGYPYCYRCAKTEVSERDLARQQSADSQYAYEKTVYAREKAAFEQRQTEWFARRREFVGSGNLGCALAIIAAVVGYQLADATAKGFGLVGVVAAFVVWAFISNAREKQRDAEFRDRDPEPQFEHTEPQRADVLPVYHSPDVADGTDFVGRNYREEVLCRDGYTCQVCGKRRQRRTLEVHHILPRSKGGDDDPTNLITLCKYCHDRENWYEHVRMFPTTIKKKTRTKYRRRW